METIAAKTLISRNKNLFWFGTEFNMNIYKGCCHGCIYCDSRSECYQVENFDQVRAKENALMLIRNDLRRLKKRGVIATGSMSDPYNPFEAQEKLTHNALELINSYGFGVAIATKSDLIVRDIPILQDIASHSPVIVKMTITTIDDNLCSVLEPHVCNSSARFKALEQLSEAGIFCGILMMPVLPFIEDDEAKICKLVQQAAQSKVKFIFAFFGVTLRSNQQEYYYTQLDQYFPGLKAQYQENYQNNYTCNSPKSKRLRHVFNQECNKYGILYDMKKIIQAYKGPYIKSQLSLFDSLD